MYAQGSIMGIVAREQLSLLTDGEVQLIHKFLQKTWTAERAVREEAKIAQFPAPTFNPNDQTQLKRYFEEVRAQPNR
jgi:hypothetical protein